MDLSKIRVVVACCLCFVLVGTACSMEIYTVEENKQACDVGDGAGCFNLGLLYAKGEGVKQSYSKAADYYRKACDLGYGGGCSDLGILYRNGEGVKQSYSEAADYYRKACDLGDGDGCNNLGYEGV